MRKIRLDLDALDVESFTVSAPEPGRGTVEGLAKQTDSSCATYDDCASVETCGQAHTCFEGCYTVMGRTCGMLDSCDGLCP